MSYALLLSNTGRSTLLLGVCGHLVVSPRNRFEYIYIYICKPLQENFHERDENILVFLEKDVEITFIPTTGKKALSVAASRGMLVFAPNDNQYFLPLITQRFLMIDKVEFQIWQAVYLVLSHALWRPKHNYILFSLSFLFDISTNVCFISISYLSKRFKLSRYARALAKTNWMHLK